MIGLVEGLTSSQDYLERTEVTIETLGQYTGSRQAAFNRANTYQIAGKGIVAISVISGAIEVFNGYQKDKGGNGYRRFFGNELSDFHKRPL